MANPCLVAVALATLCLSPHAVWAAGLTGEAALSPELLIGPADDVRHPAPVDFGLGGGKPKPEGRSILSRMFAVAPAAVPLGNADAGVSGFYGPPISWPIIPIHEVLLPDGRLMSYGTGATGAQGAQFVYDVWNPALGTAAASHLALPNTTGTNIFCSSQALMWANGEVLVTGGNVQIAKDPVRGDRATNIFNPQDNSLKPSASMAYPRWYDSLISLPSGEMLTVGGDMSGAAGSQVPAAVPEIFNVTSGWRSLPLAATPFLPWMHWYYPRAFVAPNGSVLVITIWGRLYSIDVTGTGAVTLARQLAGNGSTALPSVMFAPGQILSVRELTHVVVVNVNGPAPVVTPTANISQTRYWSSATVQADGQVLISGGSAVPNALSGIAYQNETWNPATQTFRLGAVATKPRLYHSNALLLPDGSVLTGGGGAPGPVTNLNSEIYFPPYLYLNDGSGQPAPRPSLQSASNVATVGQTMTAQVGTADQIGRVTLVKAGSATHSFNADQRFMELKFSQAGQTLTMALPSNVNVLIPGYYMLFAFNKAGVPSVANMLLVLPPKVGAALVRVPPAATPAAR